jgi:hypothetical protein
LKTLVIPTEIHSKYRPSTNPKAPCSIKYISTCPVYQQVIFFARIQTCHSCRYVAFLIFVTMATYLQSSDISATDTQKLKLAKRMLVFLYFSLSILPKQRDASKYFQNVLLYYSISQLLWLSSWSLPNIPRHFVHVIFLYHDCFTVPPLLWKINVISQYSSFVRDSCYKNVVTSKREGKLEHKAHIRKLNHNKFGSDAEDESPYEL